MHSSTLIKRLATSVLSVAVGTVIMLADTTHVVNRGETLESIAQKYGVTTEQIIKSNPQAAQFVYVGMELTIPASAPATRTTESTYQPVYNTTSYQQPVQTSNTSSNNYSGPVISQWGIDYVANFSAKGKGHYGFFFEILSESGWGGFFSAGGSWGIVKPGNLRFKIGPDYGQRISESVAWSVPLCLELTTGTHVKESTHHNEISSGTIKREAQDVEKKEQKTMFGLALTPKIAFKVDRACLNAGLDINYFFEKKFKTEYKNNPLYGNSTKETKTGGKVYVGFFVAIGINQ